MRGVHDDDDGQISDLSPVSRAVLLSVGICFVKHMRLLFQAPYFVQEEAHACRVAHSY